MPKSFFHVAIKETGRVVDSPINLIPVIYLLVYLFGAFTQQNKGRLSTNLLGEMGGVLCYVAMQLILEFR